MKPSVPKYRSVKSLLQARLSREMVRGQRIPSETALCADFGVSRITMQQALGLLEKEGWIRREQGRGTFYLGQQSRVQQQTSELLESKIDPSELEMRMLHTGVQEPPPQVAEKLCLDPGAQVVMLERLGLVDREPLLFVRTYLPYELGFKLLERNEPFDRMTVAVLLSDKFGVEIAEVEQTISATLADPYFAEYLGVDVGAPILEGNRTYCDGNREPVFFTTVFYRSDRHCFVVSMKNWRNEEKSDHIKGDRDATGENLWK